MTTHRAKIAAANAQEAEKMNAEQAIAVARVLAEIEALVSCVAKLITVSQGHGDFVAGMGSYVLVDLDASAVAAQQGRDLAQERETMYKEYATAVL